jgi:hypothetical protein
MEIGHAEAAKNLADIVFLVETNTFFASDHVNS